MQINFFSKKFLFTDSDISNVHAYSYEDYNAYSYPYRDEDHNAFSL